MRSVSDSAVEFIKILGAWWFSGFALTFVFGNEDGLLDFVVGSDLQFKTYMNEGNASFVDATHILPIERTDLRPILPGDLDNDGDMDLLILTLESEYYVALNIRPFELPGSD